MRSGLPRGERSARAGPSARLAGRRRRPGRARARGRRDGRADTRRRELEPGTYRAVLEPYAVADLVRWFSYDSMGAQGFLEERSYFCGRIGEQAFDPKVSIADDALDSANLPRPFDFEGTPKQRVQMIEDGVIRGVVWDRSPPRAPATDRYRPAMRRRTRGASSARCRPLTRWPAARRARRRSWRARGRRHLRHAAPLPRHRRPPRGRPHRDDARRDVPDPRRQGRRAARQPAVHRCDVRRPRRRSRADPETGCSST